VDVVLTKQAGSCPASISILFRILISMHGICSPTLRSLAPVLPQCQPTPVYLVLSACIGAIAVHAMHQCQRQRSPRLESSHLHLPNKAPQWLPLLAYRAPQCPVQ
jgi:hypothetical protein